MSRGQTIAELQTRLQELSRTRPWADGLPAESLFVSSGCAALDQLLPEGSFRRGTLVEWLAGYQQLDDDGTGSSRSESPRQKKGRATSGRGDPTGNHLTGSGAATLA